MNRNPKIVRDLKALISANEDELHDLKLKLDIQLKLVPVGYDRVKPGELVKDGALGYEPHHGDWDKAHNSVGHTLNEEGYVSGLTHRGWRYANPI